MNELRELYQEVILEHGKSPRNFGRLEDAHRLAHGDNPLCGDRITVYVKLDDGAIEDVRFEGQGCAISQASASLMTLALKGRPVSEADDLFERFHTMVTGRAAEGFEPESLGKLAVMGGVKEFPARVKCATLAWHTLQAALHDENATVSTE